MEKLNNNEYEIMITLWRANEPLTSSKILELSINKSWAEKSLHSLINSLLNKGYIMVCGNKKATRANARLFIPAISIVQYTAMQVNDTFVETTESSLSRVLSSFMSYSNDKESLISELEEWIAIEKKKES